MDIRTVNEGSTCYLTVSFTDKDGAPAGPTQVQYRVDCVTTGQSVRPMSTLAGPSSQMTVTLTSSDTAMRVSSNREEVRRVTVVAQYGSATDQATAEFDVTVKNLRFL